MTRFLASVNTFQSRSRAELLRYLRTAVAWKIRAEGRKPQRVSRAIDATSRTDSSSGGGVPTKLLVSATPSREVASRDERIAREQELAAAIGELPNRWGEVVRLRLLDHVSVSEIATRLGISEQRVFEYLSKGMARLTSKLHRGIPMK